MLREQNINIDQLLFWNWNVPPFSTKDLRTWPSTAISHENLETKEILYTLNFLQKSFLKFRKNYGDNWITADVNKHYLQILRKEGKLKKKKQ